MIIISIGDPIWQSNVDIAVFLNAVDEKEISDIMDTILTATDRHVEILRLDDEDKSLFIIQEALKGIPLINLTWIRLIRWYIVLYTKHKA